MALAWRLDDDAARGDAAKPLLQHGNVLDHAGAQLLASFEALKVDLDRGLHTGAPVSRTPPRVTHRRGLAVLPLMGVKRHAASSASKLSTARRGRKKMWLS